MKFTPKTEKEIAEAGLWEKGTYGFEISKAEDSTSKSGNDMIVLNVKIFNDEGQFKFVTDYLLEAVPHKVRHAAYACGLEVQYESGTLLASDFVGKTGQLKLKIDKDKTGSYPDKNGIADYVVGDTPAQIDQHNKAKGDAYKPEVNDDIPW